MSWRSASLAFLLALIGVELATRALFKDTAVLFPSFQTAHAYGPVKLRGLRPKARFRHTSPEGSWTFAANSKGFRDREHSTVDVLCLGDSNTLGYEVGQDDPYPAVLERESGLTVLNAGVAGFGTAEALALLEHEGFKYRPKVVTLGFSENDLADNARRDWTPGIRVLDIIHGIPGTAWLSQRSYFYSLLLNDAWKFFRTPRPLEPVDQTSLAAELILRMHRLCKERGVRFILIDIPTFNGPYRSRPALPDALRARLKGVEIVDSRALFGRLQGKELHRRRGHQHLSELAHAVIGAELTRRLR